MNKYKVTCLSCKKSDTIQIYDKRVVDWQKSTSVNIISARRRLDNQWGWECSKCGNNDLLTVQETRQLTNKQNPDPQEIADIVKNLKPDKPTFAMVEIDN